MSDYRQRGTGGVRLLWSLAFYIFAVSLAAWLLGQAFVVVNSERAMAALSTPEEKTADAIDDLLSKITFGLYDAKEKRLKADALVAATETAQGEVRQAGIALGVLLVVFFLGSYWFRRRDGPEGQRAWLFDLHGAAAVCLIIGLIAPMLTLVAQRELPLIGEAVLQYDSKSILTTAFKLWHIQSYVVATLLTLFSIVIPIFKLCMSMLIIGARRSGFRERALRITKLIGKWSMTDVFVVSILLAFLAGGASDLTSASLGVGLYFFAAYGLLSIFGGQSLVAWLDAQSDSPAPSVGG